MSSLPARGAWIEIFSASTVSVCASSRSPHGERGLKFVHAELFCRQCATSLPARGAWIEIVSNIACNYNRKASLPARGAWIEIPNPKALCKTIHGRSPHGERGLKFKQTRKNVAAYFGRSPHGERGLKSVAPLLSQYEVASLPARGAWIEMT